MSQKTNYGLVEWAKLMLAKEARYWYGCWCQIGNAKLLSEKSKQYPRQLSAKRVETAKARGDYGHPVTDCAGLIKGYLMSKNSGFPPDYVAQYDLSADSFFTKATEKGTIANIPEIAGLGLYKKGHAGIYIGNGRVIQAKGFDYGVIEDNLADTKWTHWYKIPFIEYEYADQAEPDVPDLSPVCPQPVPDPTPSSDQQAAPLPTDDLSSDTGIYIVQRGDTLSGIAAKFGTTWQELAALNGIVNPNLILPLQRIKLPSGSAPQTALIREGTVNTVKDPLNVRSAPNGRIIGQLAKGSKVRISGEAKDGWFKLADQDGFVFAKLISF